MKRDEAPKDGEKREPRRERERPEPRDLDLSVVPLIFFTWAMLG